MLSCASIHAPPTGLIPPPSPLFVMQLHKETGMCPFTFVWPRDDAALEGSSPTGSGRTEQASPGAASPLPAAAPASTASARSTAPPEDRRSRGVGWLRRRGSAMRRAMRPMRSGAASSGSSGGGGGQGGTDDDEFVLVEADEFGVGSGES